MGIADVKLLHFENAENALGKEIEFGGGTGKIPFKIRRIFYSYASETKTVRGAHANRKSEFVLISVFGTLKVKVSDGKQEQIYDLNRPCVGLYIPQMVWKEMYDFSEDNVLLVISGEHYDPDEYIREYEEYKREISGGKE